MWKYGVIAEPLPRPKSAATSNHMRLIRTKRTEPELRVRAILRRRGVRFLGNQRQLPGSPDLVIPTSNLVIFVNGCFWHGCPRCFRPPKHNRQWWLRKIAGNRRRDQRATRALQRLGYSVMHIWEHDGDVRIANRITKHLSGRAANGYFGKACLG